MNNFITKYKRHSIIALISAIHLILTFFTDKKIFTVSPTVNISDYVLCKIILFFVLYAIYTGLYILFLSPGRKDSVLFNVIKCALPYLVVIIGVMAIKLPGGYLSNDEALIFQNAVSLTHYVWFYYITTYYYIVSLMLIPHMYGPIFVKVIIEFLVIGYVVFRIREHFGKKYGYFSYILFLLYPVIAYTTSAHRLPVYFLVYLYVVVMLLFDGLEKKPMTNGKLAWVLFLGALLTQWRTEGIYLAVLIPILLLITYSQLRSKKSLLILVVSTILIQYAVSIPQNGLVANNLGAAADDRMKPFYAYTVTNMFRNGLDREKNAEDIAIIDKYISIESIDAINDYYKDINYEDVLILYMDGFVGLRENAGITEFFNYADACKRLFKNNIDVLIKTRWGAFCYAALPYHITYTGMGIKSLISFGISIVKTVLYNLFIPVIIILAICLYSLIRKQWFNFFLTGGLMAHWFIVFVLAPASYFKYYFPIYITAYFYVMFFIMQFIYSRKKN